MADEMSPEQVAEMQRKNCIFCKIINGEIESKKVFENEHFLAILDIRPAAAGHVLLMPKEHVPILPLLSEQRMSELFALSAKVSDAVQDAMIAQRMTIFIASGYAAGQQAPHLMLHLIPREKGDGLDMLDVNKGAVDQADAIALNEVFSQATKQAFLHLGRDDLVKQHHIHKKEIPKDISIIQDTPAGPTQVDVKTPPSIHPVVRTLPDSPQDEPNRIIQGPDIRGEHVNAEFETTNDALSAALNSSPDLRRLIIAQPDLVNDYIQKSPKLTKLFEGVNVRALSLMLQRQEAERQPLQRRAQQMNAEELFQFIDGNQGLRTWLLEHPEELAQRIPENPRLQNFFDGVDIRELARKYRERRGAA